MDRLRSLVLSGGGLWALAGIGVWRALLEWNLSVDAVVGCSAGAVVGALIAAGYSPDELSEWAAELVPGLVYPRGRDLWRRLWTGTLSQSLLGTPRVWSHLPGWLRDDFSQLKLPLWIVVTSLAQRSPVVLGPSPAAGDYPVLAAPSLIGALKATNAVPGLFDPITIAHDVFVDGGVLNDYPVDVAAQLGATTILGVWIDAPSMVGVDRLSRPHLGHVLSQSIAAMVQQMSHLRQSRVGVPRVDLRIERTEGHRVFHRIPDIIEVGYQTAWASRHEIASLFGEGPSTVGTPRLSS